MTSAFSSSSPYGRTATRAAVVVGVGLAPSLRPAARQTPSAGFAANEAAQGKVGMCALARRRARHTARQNRLDAVEQVFRDQWLEVAALGANAVLGDVDDPGVQLVAQQQADRL